VIGKARTGDDFGGLQQYLLVGKGGGDRVAWVTSRNLWIEDPELAGEQMAAVAAQNTRVEKPVYHLSLAVHPDEALTREQWEAVADRVVADLGLRGHQVLLVAHNDEEHQHVHLMVNRVHPDTHRTWDNKNDWRRIEQSLREVERELGLRQVRGHHARSAGDRPPDRARSRSSAELHEAGRKGEAAWVDQVRQAVRPLLQRAEGWRHLEELLGEHGLQIERRGQGLVVTDGERVVKASRVARSASAGRLADRFGEGFDDWSAHRGEIERAAERFLEGREGGRRGWTEELPHEKLVARLGRLEVDATFRSNLVPGDELDELLRRAERTRLRLPRDHSETVPIGRWLDFRDVVAAAVRQRRDIAQELSRQLVELYGRDGAGAARRALVRFARREGWSEAALELGRRPQRFGRPDGPISRLFRDPAPPEHRSYFASIVACNYATARGERRFLRSTSQEERTRLLRNIRRTRLDRHLAAVTPASARLIRPRPSQRSALEAIAAFAARRGIRALQNALTPPTLRIVLAALRTARLLSHTAQRQERSR